MKQAEPLSARSIPQLLKEVEGVSQTFFDARDVVRHPIVRRIVDDLRVQPGVRDVGAHLPGPDHRRGEQH